MQNVRLLFFPGLYLQRKKIVLTASKKHTDMGKKKSHGASWSTWPINRKIKIAKRTKKRKNVDTSLYKDRETSSNKEKKRAALHAEKAKRESILRASCVLSSIKQEQPPPLAFQTTPKLSKEITLKSELSDAAMFKYTYEHSCSCLSTNSRISPRHAREQ